MIAQAQRPVLPGLTGIRFVAALMVLLFHFGAGFAQRAHLPSPMVTFLTNGYVGVSLFFMLSGFIITYTYDGRLKSRVDLRDYAVARFSRIYPVYLLALVVSLPFAWEKLRPGPSIAVLAMVQSWTVPASQLGDSWVTQAWTLSVEFAFYLSAPFLLRALRSAPTGLLAVIGAGCAVAMSLLWVPGNPPGTITEPFPWVSFVPIPILRGTEFLFGIVLCKLFLRFPTRTSALSTNAPTILNVAVIVFLLALTPNRTLVGAAMVLTGLLLAQIASNQGVIPWLLARSVMLRLGAASFALYLLQYPVREYLRLLLPPSVAEVANSFVAIGISILVYALYEEPARRRLKRVLLGSAA